jgi:leader peptidase (prepilin peptidase)/N-methyltransferase
MINIQPFLVVICPLAGLIFGSFLNVVIWRVPNSLSVVKPGSFCPNCRSPIKWYDNIPIFSWIFLGGHCRNCSKSISFQYPAVEISNAILWYFCAEFVKPLVAIPVSLVFVSSMLSLSIIDFKYLRLPNKIIYPSALLSAMFLVGASAYSAKWLNLLSAAATAAAALTLFALIFLLAPKGGFGFGDVRLAGFQGLVLGWFGWKLELANIIFTFILAGFFGLAVLATGKKKMKDKLAFGPFMAISALIILILAHSLFSPWLLKT